MVRIYPLKGHSMSFACISFVYYITVCKKHVRGEEKVILNDDKEGEKYLRHGKFKDEVKIEPPGGTFNLFFTNAL